MTSTSNPEWGPPEGQGAVISVVGEVGANLVQQEISRRRDRKGRSLRPPPWPPGAKHMVFRRRTSNTWRSRRAGVSTFCATAGACKPRSVSSRIWK